MLSEDARLLAEQIYVQMLARRVATGAAAVPVEQAALDARDSIVFAECFLAAWKERVSP